MIFYILGLLSYYKLARKPVPANICLQFFAIVAVPPSITLFFLINKHWAFQLIAFAGGLFCWTFVEYFVHRFLMHGKKDYQKSNHFHHHTNPTIIFTGQVKRIIFSLVAILFVAASMLFSPYLLLPAGFITGFAAYINMHRILHSAWAAKWLNGLQKFHMQHHLGQTEKCFGVTTMWWDKLFNTAGNSDKGVSAKKIELYFGNKDNQLASHKQAV